jgi:hypothetical protein
MTLGSLAHPPRMTARVHREPDDPKESTLGHFLPPSNCALVSLEYVIALVALSIVTPKSGPTNVRAQAAT